MTLIENTDRNETEAPVESLAYKPSWPTAFHAEQCYLPEALARWLVGEIEHVGRHLVVVYTWRAEHIRIISARKASKAERLRYDAGT